ncbi:hypothetical protein [Frankia sp. Cr2]|uniref:hypothetical protein n=1 Tax=Frankia sp. Cr2 TaxID=3073932 RepID=UPI002AD2FFEE|nr:hypothetical protein [Frankia sp. Cr2]
MTANVTNADAGLRHNASSMDLPAPSPGWVVAGGGVHDPQPGELRAQVKLGQSERPHHVPGASWSVEEAKASARPALGHVAGRQR